MSRAQEILFKCCGHHWSDLNDRYQSEILNAMSVMQNETRRETTYTIVTGIRQRALDQMREIALVYAADGESTSEARKVAQELADYARSLAEASNVPKDVALRQELLDWEKLPPVEKLAFIESFASPGWSITMRAAAAWNHVWAKVQNGT